MPHAGTDKRKILATLIEQAEAKLAELQAGYGAARDAVLSTPHVMKGKREVSGQESAYLANALALNIQERERELRTLRGMRLPEQPERVALGCLVGVGAADGALRRALLCASGVRGDGGADGGRRRHGPDRHAANAGCEGAPGQVSRR